MGRRVIGELVVLDIGGATTDVHSIARGAPTEPGLVKKGLPEPYVKRTVEGDLGMRYNASTIVQVAGEDLFVERLGSGKVDLHQMIGRFSVDPGLLPEFGGGEDPGRSSRQACGPPGRGKTCRTDRDHIRAHRSGLHPVREGLEGGEDHYRRRRSPHLRAVAGEHSQGYPLFRGESLLSSTSESDLFSR